MQTSTVKFEDQVISDVMPTLTAKINAAIEPIIRDALKQVIGEATTYETMKLSEKSFAEIWENEEDKIWDEY
jgi:hypothetical protein